MKVYVSADIEGVTGVVSWNFQCGSPDQANPDWDFARRMMTHDVNAAIRGACKAGAEYVLVKDSHNVGKNLLISDLECPQNCVVELISGAKGSKDGMMDGIDSTFDAAFLVGYHAAAGVGMGVMEHTISGRIHRCRINGIEAGEQLFSMYTAGDYGVPVSLVTSDDWGCREAASIVPGITTAEVKSGLGRHFARLRHPSVTGPLIESMAGNALRNIPAELVPPSPLLVEIEFNRSEEAGEASLMPGFSIIDAYTIQGDFADWSTAHQSIRRAMTLASTAST